MIIEDTKTARKTGSGGRFSFETVQVADDWRDLSQGEVHVQNTSFTAEQTEAAEIYKGLQASAWPDVWYELVQGAFEYNDWSKGLPEVIITYADGESVSLQSFVREWPRSQRIVRKVVIQNHIRGASGLRPSNTYLTHHQEKDGKTEFGKYGRGMKGAFTAIAAELLAERVTFESFAPGIGSWFGEARMAKDRDPQAPEYYQVAYKVTQQEQVALTSITVEKPSALMLVALVKLQDWFLPLHPDYQFSPLSSPDHVVERQTANPTTLSRSKFAQIHSPYSSAENEYLDNNFPENGRAEILSRNLFADLGNGMVDWLYVDGWRVRNQNAKFANIYAFSGMSENSDQTRNPRRSNDSLWVENSFENLLADVLYFSHDPEVFYRIFKYGLNNPSCAEWNIGWFESSTLALFPETLAAITKAWKRYAAEYNYPIPLYVSGTNEDDAANAEKKYGIKVLRLTSSIWTKILIQTGEVSSLTAFLALEAAKQEAKANEALWKAGILEKASAIGESVKLRPKSLSPEHQYDWLAELAYELAGFEGSVRYSENEQTLQINLNEHAVDGMPETVSQLNELNKLINHFYAMFGGAAIVVIEAHQENVATYMNFSYNASPDRLGNNSLNTYVGKLVPSEKRGVVVSFALNQNNRDLSKSEKQQLRKFFEYLLAELKKISFPDGRIDPEAYRASKIAEHHPQSRLLFQLSQQRAQMQAEMMKELAAMNKVLARAGLPLKKMADFAEKQIEPSAAVKSTTIGSRLRGMFRGQLPARENGTDTSPFFENKKIKNGPRTLDKFIDIGDPDEVWGLSSLGEKEALLQTNQEKTWYERWRQRLRDALEEALQMLVSPDISFNPGPGQFEHNRYLVHSIDSSYSSVTLQDYQPLATELIRKRQFNKTSITFNKADKATTIRALPCPYGYRPVGYYNSSGVEVIFSGMPERGFFAFRSPKGIEAGLTVYFEPIPGFADTLEPDEYEASIKVIEDNLEQHWRDLIAGLRISSLTDKQKVDVLLRAWKRNQSYKKTQTTFDQYQGLGGVMLATTVANLAEGNCGYIDLGFIGLVSTLLPTRSVKSFLFSGSGLDVSNNKHGLSQVYIDGRWVAIEAQGRYVQQGYQIEPVPEESRNEIEALFEQVPQSLLSGSFGEMALADGAVKVDRSRVVPSIQLAMLLASLQTVGVDVKVLMEKSKDLLTPDEKFAADDLKKLALRASATIGLAVAGTQLIDSFASKLADILVNYRIAVEGLPAGIIFDKIYESLGFLEDPRTILVLVLLLTATAWQGGYNFGRMDSIPLKQNPVTTDSALAPAEAKELNYDRP